MSRKFENAWHDLNVRLRELEQEEGLAAALRALETHHLNSGFIKDAQQQVDRTTYYHPDDPTRYFRVQYNPRRAFRFVGSGRKDEKSSNRKNGCFLCRDNIEWQQHGTQLGYRVETARGEFTALANPFPILPGHIVMASTEHRTQEWRFGDANGLDVVELIEDLVCIADRMPSYLGFYNGVDAGASIPGHLHYQFIKRPRKQNVFPLETAARHVGDHKHCPGRAKQYPLDVAVWKGDAGEIIARAPGWMARWGERNHARLAKMTANFIAARDSNDNQVALYFVPRVRAKTHADGFSGLAGGLEALGEIVLSSPEEKARLSDGSIDYANLEAALASLHAPLEID